MTTRAPRETLPLLVIDETVHQTGAPLSGRTKLTKLVFLLQARKPQVVKSIAGEVSPYEFIPYNYGPFSKQLLNDLEALKAEGEIRIGIRQYGNPGTVIEHVYDVTPAGKDVLSAVAGAAAIEARSFVAEFAGMDRRALVELVHREYPLFVG